MQLNELLLCQFDRIQSMGRRKERRRRQREAKKRQKNVDAYTTDPAFNFGIKVVCFIVAIAMLFAWLSSLVLSPSLSHLLNIVVCIVTVIACASFIALFNSYASNDLVDKHQLRCPKCGNPSVKTPQDRMSQLPDHGTRICYSCEKELVD